MELISAVSLIDLCKIASIYTSKKKEKEFAPTRLSFWWDHSILFGHSL